MAAVKIRELPEEDRPREKLLKRGADALTNRELIAILLRTGVRGKNAVEVGGEILEKYKTLSGLTRTSASELKKIRGIDSAKAVQLAAAFKLGERMAKEKISREKIDSPELVNESIAHPREVFRPALLAAAYALIVVHNHPSGDPTPSSADHSLTRQLTKAAELLQIKLLDHVIIGSPGEGRAPYFSFKEAGVL